MNTWFSTRSPDSAKCWISFSFLAMGTLSGCLSPDFTYLPSKKARIATAQKSSIEAASIVAFETTVHPVLRSYCAGCHASTQSPFFASPDVGTAHTELIQAAKVNFQDIPSSRLIQRLSLDLHNCWKDCAVAAAEMRSAIEEWSRLRGAETGMTGQTTAKVRIPAGLGTTALTLNFPIETLLNPALRGAVIDLSVVKFDNYSYRFFNPRIRSTTATAVYVKGIKLVMNGIVPTGSTTYNAIDQVVTTSAGTTGTTLSTSSMILEMARGPGNDEIALNFEALTYGSGAALAAQRFSTARQSLQQNCNGCHTNDASGLRPNFGSLQTEADFRAAVWKNSPLIVPGNSAASVLYKVVAGTQTPAMPPNASTANRTPIATTLRNWIDGMQ